MTSFIKRRIITSETLGERLRKIREGRGLDFSEIEARINIRADFLECLEEGDYGSLPGEVYTKSFLKVYGVFLGIAEEEVVEQYEKERKVDDYKAVVEHAAGGRDLFGNKAKGLGQRFALGWRKATRNRGNKLSFRNIVLSQIFIKGIIVVLIFGVLFYLGFAVKGILTVPSLTVLKPVDNLVVRETRIEVKGKVEQGASLEINDGEVIYDEKGNFSEMVDLHLGLNEIVVSAKKAHSREVVVVRRVMVK